MYFLPMINQLLNILSPFENVQRSSGSKNYQRDKVQVRVPIHMVQNSMVLPGTCLFVCGCGKSERVLQR
jgi:hypothetical protein